MVELVLVEIRFMREVFQKRFAIDPKIARIVRLFGDPDFFSGPNTTSHPSTPDHFVNLDLGRFGFPFKSVRVSERGPIRSPAISD